MRCEIYKTLDQFWTLVVVVLNTKHLKLFLEQIENDIFPKKSVIKLQKQSKTTKNLKNQTIGQMTPRNSVNYETTIAALKACRSCLNRIGPHLNQSLQFNFCSKIIHMLLEIYRNYNNLPQPYDCHLCRKSLLKLLLGYTLNFSSYTIQTAVIIFSTASRTDENVEIKKLCFEANSMLNVLLHPRRPCLVAATPVITTEASEAPAIAEVQTDSLLPETVPENESIQRLEDLESPKATTSKEYVEFPNVDTFNETVTENDDLSALKTAPFQNGFSDQEIIDLTSTPPDFDLINSEVTNVESSFAKEETVLPTTEIKRVLISDEDEELESSKRLKQTDEELDKNFEDLIKDFNP